MKRLTVLALVVLAIALPGAKRSVKRYQQQETIECRCAKLLDEHARQLFRGGNSRLSAPADLASKVDTYLKAGVTAYAKTLVGTKDEFGRVLDAQHAETEAKLSVKSVMHAVKAAEADCRKSKQ